MAPTLGGGFAALLVLLVFHEAAGSGLAHTKAALYISDGYVPFSTVAGEIRRLRHSIGAGNSLGPEDPALQMGAGVASRLGRAFAAARSISALIVPVGAAAGIAAAFNTPITAVLFVIEEVIGSWNASVLGSIVLSAVSAVVVARWFHGDDPLFRVPALRADTSIRTGGLRRWSGWPAACWRLFVRLLGRLRGRLARRAARAGACCCRSSPGPGRDVGLWLPQVMGAGYGAIDSALHNQFSGGCCSCSRW